MRVHKTVMSRASRSRLAMTRVSIMLCALALTLAGLGPPAVAGQGSSRSTLTEAYLQQVADAAEAAGSLGYYYDRAANEFVIVLTDTAAPRALPLDVRYRFEFQSITREVVEVTEGRIRNAATQELREGESLGFYFDVRLGRVVIDSVLPPERFDTLVADLGDRVLYRQNSAGGREGRFNDAPSFWGGAAIDGPVYGCSTGFTVENGGGERFMMTAGHCALSGQHFYTPAGTHVGYAYFRKYPPNAIKDMELVRGEVYGAHIYDGPYPDVDSASPVNGAGNPVIGYDDYCVSGRTTYAHCSHELISNEANLCYAEGCLDHLSAYSGATFNRTEKGDSGAPWYIRGSSSGTVAIRGMHIAREGTVMYAQKWSTIHDTYNVSIVTDET